MADRVHVVMKPGQRRALRNMEVGQLRDSWHLHCVTCLDLP